mmetsp:Transcript_66956/g.143171  ORF Transcript_66956/g.143171 Transcript_66956/m.143171 type:complete len:202 (-) Transcript_66956:265-870(-)
MAATCLFASLKTSLFCRPFAKRVSSMARCRSTTLACICSSSKRFCFSHSRTRASASLRISATRSSSRLRAVAISSCARRCANTASSSAALALASASATAALQRCWTSWILRSASARACITNSLWSCNSSALLRRSASMSSSRARMRSSYSVDCWTEAHWAVATFRVASTSASPAANCASSRAFSAACAMSRNDWTCAATSA